MKLRPSKFAVQAGVTRQAIGQKIKNGTLVVDAAGFLDTDNPINSAYISEQGHKPKKAVILPFTASTRNAAIETPENMATPPPIAETELLAAAGVPASELLNYTLRDLVTKYSGGIYNLEKHARTLQNLTTAADKEQRMAERAMRLIPKDFVAARVFPFLDTLIKKIMEYVETEADNIITKVLSDGTEAKGTLIEMMQDGLSRIVAGTKGQVTKELQSLKGRHDLNADAPDGGND